MIKIGKNSGKLVVSQDFFGTPILFVNMGMERNRYVPISGSTYYYIYEIKTDKEFLKKYTGRETTFLKKTKDRIARKGSQYYVVYVEIG
mgnify:CR=1 FL=1